MTTTTRPLNVVTNVQRYGSVVGQPSPDRALRIGKAIKTIIAADGNASEAEMTAFADLAVQFGAAEHFAALAAYDPRTGSLEALLEGLGDGALSRRMLYDAIAISSIDGYADAERAAVHKAAVVLRIDAATVALLEGLVVAEAGLGAIRAKLLG